MKDTKIELTMYDFASFSEEMVRNAFGLKQTLSIEGYLTDWMARAEPIPVTEEEQKQLNRLNGKLKLFIRGWNEMELREKFISAVIELVDFDLYDLQIAAFSEREMKATYHNAVLQGKVEWMVARGIYAPNQPFFFIHEYKKEKDASNDPLGQLLVTLWAAQLLNQQAPKSTLFNPHPISFVHIPLYGIYIVGRLWFFVRLIDHQYCVSKAYNTEEMEDLVFILKMLKAQKQMIVELVEGLN